MEWILLSLLAFLMFGIGGIIDSISIKKYVKSPKIWLFYSTFMQGFIGIFIILFKDISFHGFFFFIISFITGLFYVYGLLPYMKSLEFEEVSRIIPLFGLGPIFVLILSIIILNIKLTSYQYTGFFFLIVGGFLITLKRDKSIFRISKGFWYMMLTNFILAGFFIGTHYLFKNYDYWSAFFFIQLGILISSLSLILFKEYGRDGLIKIKRWGLNVKILILSVALISFIGLGLRNTAISLKSAALVSSIGGFQPLFVLIMTIFLSLKFPEILKEEIRKEVILLKIFAIVLLMVGVYFISI